MFRKLLLVLILCCVTLGAQAPPPRGSVVSRSNPLVKGLVGAWSAPVQGAGGNTLTDFSGYGRNASLVGNPVWQDASIFFESSQYGTTSISVSVPFTVVAYIKLAAASDSQFVVSLNDPSVARDQYYLGTTPSGTVGWTFAARNILQGGLFNWMVGPSPSTEWTQLVGVAESTSLRHLYVDGVYAGSNAVDVPEPDVQTLDVGRLGDSSPTYTDSSVRFVAVYNRVLTPSEIRQLTVDPHAWLRAANTSWLYAETGGTPPATYTNVIMISMVLGIFGLATAMRPTRKAA
jgi:hypothetical protein